MPAELLNFDSDVVQTRLRSERDSRRVSGVEIYGGMAGDFFKSLEYWKDHERSTLRLKRPLRRLTPWWFANWADDRPQKHSTLSIKILWSAPHLPSTILPSKCCAHVSQHHLSFYSSNLSSTITAMKHVLNFVLAALVLGRGEY